MDLQNLLPHKRGTRVLVDGTVYEIDKEGVCRDVPEDAATKLLQNVDAWEKYDPKAAEAKVKARTEAAKARGAKVKLLDAAGQPVNIDEPTKEVETAEADAKVADDQAAVEQAVEAAEQAKQTEWEVPDEDGEWPDPVPEMPMEYLKQMADAYEVSYAANIGAKTLIERIKDAMYE